MDAGPPMEIRRKKTSKRGLMICPGIETMMSQVRVVSKTTR
jgi:hypothetical protein